MATKSQVALVRCDRYDHTLVKTAVEQGLHLLGGISRFVKTGEHILLKPNVLLGVSPEKCATTHPTVLKAVAEICLEAGGDVLVGDSPGIGKPISALKKSGLLDIIQALKLEIADFETGEAISFPEGSLIKLFVIAKGVLEVDGLISLPKLKTHGLMKMTGAIKNQFGCIPGMFKSEFHFKLPNVDLFAQMLVDLTRFLEPRLYIMDGIIGMQGNGPLGGTPKPLNILLFSSDPAALDATACRLLGVEPEHILTLKWASKLGLGVYRQEHIEVLGESLESLQDFEFDAERSMTLAENSPEILLPGFSPVIKNFVSPRPLIDPSLCSRCGSCVQICPVRPKAVDFPLKKRTDPPGYKYNRCIRCFCCQEICPESAISIQVPLLGRLIHRIFLRNIIESSRA